MGKGGGATVSVQNLGWEDLAEAAEKAGKPSVVVDLIRENELDAATALLLEEADVDEVAPKRLDKLKVVSALGHLRARADEILDDSFRDRTRVYVEPPELAAVTADAPRLDGEKVARDRRTVGEGRFGTVVSAATWQRSRREEMRVALKRPKARGDADARARVAPADLFALRELPNPNVVEMYGVASVDGELNVVMELAKASLAAGIRDGLGRNRLDAVRAARDVALGLDFLHQHGISHLGLHPENVLLADRSTVHCKLSDFGGGVAAATQRAAAGSRYAAPELLRDEADVQPTKCDAWSYGSVLLELLSGKAPWDELAPKELVARAASGVPPPPPPLPDAASVAAPELLDLASRCLTVDPAPRPQFNSSENVEAHLDHWLLKAAVAAPSTAPRDDRALDRAARAEAELAKVHKLLAEEQRKDSDAYARAWDDCVRGAEREAIDELKMASAELEETFAPPDGIVRQPVAIASAEELLARAGDASDAFHATLRPIVEEAGGTYKKGPLKLEDRIRAKANDDYDDDVARVVDVVRATGVFDDLVSCGQALAQLLALGRSGDLLIRRAKDRINRPVENSGYRDVLVNVEIAGFVGELQLSLARLLEVKGSAHRIYNLTRALGGNAGLLEALDDGSRIENDDEDARRAAATKAAREEEEEEARRQREEEVRRAAKGAEVDRADKDGWTPLYNACKNGHVDAARLLLDNGAAVDRAVSEGWQKGRTPLYAACEKGHVDAARLLLDNGAKVGRATKDGRTPLYAACQNGHVDAARLLLDNGAKVDRADEDRLTPLLVACDNGHVDAARLLLDKGADVNRADKYGQTPLFVACAEGHVDAARLLLDKGAEVDRATENGVTPLWTACANGLVDAARLLLDKGAEVDRADKDGQTPLYVACRYGHVDAARLLLDNGAKVDRADKDGQTPLYVACENGRVDAARLLLDKGAEVDRADKDGETPLYIACENGRVDAARLLLEKGAEVDRATKDGATPLYVALEEGTEVVQLLLDNVTDVSCSLAFAEKKDDSAIIDLLEGHLDKPLHVAAKAGNLDEIKRLLEGDVRLCDSRTALRVASMAGDTDTINLLLKRGAKVNRAARDGKTALHAACQNGQIDAVRLLLGKGAKVDRVDKEKTTPLHVACELGHAEVARLLLEKGAKPDKKNGKGLTPAAIAKSNQAVSGVLRRYAK